jgi:hypothetical protein
MEDLVFAAIGYNLEYSAEAHGSSGGALTLLEAYARILKWSLPLFLVPVALAPRLLTEYWKRARHESPVPIGGHRLFIYLLLWLCADLSGALLSGQTYAHYFFPVHVPLGLLAIVGFHIYSQRGQRLHALAVGVFIAIAAAGNMIDSLRFTFRQAAYTHYEAITQILGNPDPTTAAVDLIRGAIVYGTLAVIVLATFFLYRYAFAWKKLSADSRTISAHAPALISILLLGTVFLTVPDAKQAYLALRQPERTALMALADWIRNATPVDARILVWNHDVRLYHHTDRNPSQRLLTNIHFTEVKGETLDAMVKGALEDLQTSPPAVVIDNTRPTSIMPQLECSTRPDATGIYARFPALMPINDYICSEYTLHRLDSVVRVYVSKQLDLRNDTPPPDA